MNHLRLGVRSENGSDASAGNSTGKRILHRPSKPLLAAIVIAVGVTGFLTSAYAFHFFGPGKNCWARPLGGPNTVVFTIVAADEGQNIGFNASKAHGVSSTNPWPVMNVTLGQKVIIHLINNDTQAHGFQIFHYFDQGLGSAGLAPGTCYDVTFTANTLGTFTVRCDIFCTIHSPYMQYGELNVNQ